MGVWEWTITLNTDKCTPGGCGCVLFVCVCVCVCMLVFVCVNVHVRVCVCVCVSQRHVTYPFWPRTARGSGCGRTGPWSVTARRGESTAAALAEPASSTAPHGERSSGCLFHHLLGRRTYYTAAALFAQTARTREIHTILAFPEQKSKCVQAQRCGCWDAHSWLSTLHVDCQRWNAQGDAPGQKDRPRHKLTSSVT